MPNNAHNYNYVNLVNTMIGYALLVRCTCMCMFYPILHVVIMLTIVTITHYVDRLLDYLIHTDQLIAKCRNIDIGGLIMEVST